MPACAWSGTEASFMCANAAAVGGRYARHVPSMCWNRPDAVEVGFCAFGFQPDSFWTMLFVASHWAPVPHPRVLNTILTSSCTRPVPEVRVLPPTTEVNRSPMAPFTEFHSPPSISPGMPAATLTNGESPNLPTSSPTALIESLNQL